LVQHSLRYIKKASAETRDPAFWEICSSTKFKGFLIALAVAILAILIRCAFRCAELSPGFDDRLANQEATFMVLEGSMIIVAVISLTNVLLEVASQGKGVDAGWKLDSSKKENRSNEVMMALIDRRSIGEMSFGKAWGWR